MKTRAKSYKTFPKNISLVSYVINKSEGIVTINGFRKFNLKSLKRIDLNSRINYPHDLFVAIDRS